MGSRMEYDQLSELKQIKEAIREIKKLCSETAVGTPVEQQLTCTRPEFVWSVEKDDSYDLIRFNYHEEFNKFIKTLNNVLWWDPRGCWKYNSNNDEPDFIIDEIKDKFPEWTFIDKR